MASLLSRGIATRCKTSFRTSVRLSNSRANSKYPGQVKFVIVGCELLQDRTVFVITKARRSCHISLTDNAGNSRSVQYYYHGHTLVFTIGRNCRVYIIMMVLKTVALTIDYRTLQELCSKLKCGLRYKFRCY